VGRGHGHAEPGGEVEPQGGGEEGGGHADGEEGGGVAFGHALDLADGLGVDDTLADGVRDVGTHEHGAGELAGAGRHDGALDRNGPGTHGVGHGVGHVVGPDVPGHVQAEKGRDADDEEGHASVRMGVVTP
jgi:hypothetical protein